MSRNYLDGVRRFLASCARRAPVSSEALGLQAATVDSLLSHTCWEGAKVMGYDRLCDMGISAFEAPICALR